MAYSDTPLTNFPDKEDNWARMSDITSTLASVALQYNQLWESGQLDQANNLLQSYPSLKNCIFNADKWNKMRDSIIAIERYYLNDVQTMINKVAQNTVGINDSPESVQKPNVAYSAYKTENLIKEKIQTFSDVKTVTFSSDGWYYYSTHYTQTVFVDWALADDDLLLVKSIDYTTNMTTLKQYNKAFNALANGCGTTYNGYITWTCPSRPTIDITVGFKGVTKNL